MIKLVKPVVFICILFATISASAMAPFEMEAMTEEDLKPWCDNKKIWGEHNISSEQCLKIAVPCSAAVASKKLSFNDSNAELYYCTFEGLGIDTQKMINDSSKE